jgi:hypothetical protein
LVWHSLHHNKDAFHCCFFSNNNKLIKNGSLEANISCHYINIFYTVLKTAKYLRRNAKSKVKYLFQYCIRCTKAHFYAILFKIPNALIFSSTCRCPYWRFTIRFPTEFVSLIPPLLAVTFSYSVLH